MRWFHRCTEHSALITCQRKQYDDEDGEIHIVNRPAVTTALYRCRRCGDHRGEDVLGNWTLAELAATESIEAMAL